MREYAPGQTAGTREQSDLRYGHSRPFIVLDENGLPHRFHLNHGRVERVEELTTGGASWIPSVTMTVGAEAANQIIVAVQFKDALGNNLAQRSGFLAWLSDSAYAIATGDVPSGGWATSGAGYWIADAVANTVGWFGTNANGLVNIVIIEAAADTWYLHVLFDGVVYVSGAITFA